MTNRAALAMMLTAFLAVMVGTDPDDDGAPDDDPTTCAVFNHPRCIEGAEA